MIFSCFWTKWKSLKFNKNIIDSDTRKKKWHYPSKLRLRQHFISSSIFLSDELYFGGINLSSNSTRDAIESGVGRRPSTPTQLLYIYESCKIALGVVASVLILRDSTKKYIIFHLKGPDLNLSAHLVKPFI